MTSEDWQTWEDQWRTGGTPEAELRAMVERARRARREVPRRAGERRRAAREPARR